MGWQHIVINYPRGNYYGTFVGPPENELKCKNVRDNTRTRDYSYYVHAHIYIMFIIIFCINSYMYIIIIIIITMGVRIMTAVFVEKKIITIYRCNNTFAVLKRVYFTRNHTNIIYHDIILPMTMCKSDNDFFTSDRNISDAVLFKWSNDRSARKLQRPSLLIGETTITISQKWKKSVYINQNRTRVTPDCCLGAYLFTKENFTEYKIVLSDRHRGLSVYLYSVYTAVTKTCRLYGLYNV